MFSIATRGKVLPSDEDEGDDDIKATYPLEDLLGIGRKKVTGARLGVKDEEECGERYKPDGELFPHSESVWREKQDNKHNCECPHAIIESEGFCHKVITKNTVSAIINFQQIVAGSKANDRKQR